MAREIEKLKQMNADLRKELDVLKTAGGTDVNKRLRALETIHMADYR